jgi:predicted CoA-binding protein
MTGIVKPGSSCTGIYIVIEQSQGQARMNTPTLINEFLSQKRFAMVGVSRNARHFSRPLFKDLTKRGFDVVPVNPAASAIDGKQCFARVSDVRPRVTSVLVMITKKEVQSVLRDCADAGVTLVWVHGINGPYMFLHNAGLVHRLHGRLWKMVGLYPR